MDAAQAKPLGASEREAFVDALRGVAILGVLVAYTLWNLGSPPVETWTRADVVVNTVAELLVDAKFLTIFAFLFGAGVAHQWQRLEARGVDPVPVHARRMSFLFMAGLLHGALLRNGDILAPYAILGIALLATRPRSNRALAAAAIVLALLPYALQWLMREAGWSLVARPGPEAGNLDWLRYWYLTNPVVSWPRILAVMAAGVLAQRTGLIAAVAKRRRLALGIVAGALPLAVAARLVVDLLAAHADAQPRTLARGVAINFFYHLSAWSLAAVYAAALALVCRNAARAARLSWLRAVGRMAFTNYLLQPAIVVPICIAFGLFDAVTPTIGLLLAGIVAAFQIPFSTWWLRRFTYGPVEGLWRRVTYGTAPIAHRPVPGS